MRIRIWFRIRIPNTDFYPPSLRLEEGGQHPVTHTLTLIYLKM
jgi:hypothetical protein